MKAGDEVTVYGVPSKEQYPIGKAKLIKLVEDYGTMENWVINFPDEKFNRVVLIKKPKDEIN